MQSLQTKQQYYSFANSSPTLEHSVINFDNYGPYVDLAYNGTTTVYTKEINNGNIDSHFFGLLNIFRDGIESAWVQHMKIKIIFTDNITVDLYITDYLFNLIFWKLPVSAGDKLTSYFLFFTNKFTQDCIKKYIDDKFLSHHRTEYSNIVLNNMIDDTLYKFKFLDEFSLYILNTINNEDTIKLMNMCPEFNDIIHLDISQEPIETVKSKIKEKMNRAIDIITNSDHCLASSLMSGEGVNKKQLEEFYIDIGPKPDGNGGVIPKAINSSYSMDGVNNVADYYIDSRNGRNAQIIQKNNVGQSGHLSRIVGLNNMDTRLHKDPNYSCDTKNFIKIFIKDAAMLDMFKNRWYRYTPNGMEYQLPDNPVLHRSNLIGQELLFRSPVTCASNSRGHGICYKCYGGLAHINNDINIGKIGAELITSRLTQKQLSAKHLLEAQAVQLQWSNGFFDIFEFVGNIVKVQDDFNCKKWKIVINYDDISTEDELDDFEFNEYINIFEVLNPAGESIKIFTSEGDNLYFAKEFNTVLTKKGEPIDGKYVVDLAEISTIGLFLVNITNNELSKTLDGVKNILNKDSVTRAPGMTKDKIVQDFIESIIGGNLHVDAIHCEVLLSNQIRAIDNILELPQWEYPNESYQLITLNKALTDNPSITISLMYQKLSKSLYYPLTFNKTKSSSIDLVYMEKPQEYMTMIPEDNGVETDIELQEVPAVYYEEVPDDIDNK